jgi:large conductance mechanosensitive channel
MIKNIIKEFRDFAVKGNMLDMAVGIIIGGAFGTVVNSLVKDLIMPPISLVLAKVNFSNLFFVLKQGAVDHGPYPSIDAAAKAGAVILNIGSFLNAAISFLVVAWAVFILVKAVNKFKSRSEPAQPNTKKCPFCAMDIPMAAIKCPACTADLNK